MKPVLTNISKLSIVVAQRRSNRQNLCRYLRDRPLEHLGIQSYDGQRYDCA